MTPRTGLKVNDREAFELLQFTVNGQEKKIRRTERKSGQTYSVNLGEEVMREGKPVRIGHTYRTVTAKSRHGLRLAIAQPTRDFSVNFDYTDTEIADLVVSDLVSSTRRARITRSPEDVAAKEIALDVPGWLLPQAQITYIWTLASEQDATDHAYLAAA